MKEKLNDFCHIFRNPRSTKDIIFLHGFTDNKRTQEPMANSIANDHPNYDVIQCDARGHGVRKDIGHPLDWNGSLEDINQIIKSRNRDTVLIGHSMGATIALSLGIKNPKVKKVFAIAAGHGDNEIIANRLQYYKDHFNISSDKDEYIKTHVIPILPAPYEQCHSKNRNKFYLIHAKNDQIVPFSEFTKNKQDLCIPDENTLVYDNIPTLTIGYDLGHILPFFLPKTKSFIDKKLID